MATVVWYYASLPVVRMFASAPFISAASTGKLYVRVLNDLREGRIDNATQRLEQMLDGDILVLANYEDALPPQARDRNIYAAVAVMRQYRQQVPTVMQNPQVLQELKRSLALGATSGNGNATGP